MLFSLYRQDYNKKEGTPSWQEPVPSFPKYIPKEVSRYYDTHFIIRKYPSADTIEDFFETVIDHMMEKKTLFLHVYHSVNRELFEHYLWQVCERLVILYTDSVLEGRRVSSEDRRIIVQYLKALSFGVVSSWLQSGLTDEIRVTFERIYQLKKGTVEEMIRRFEA